MGKAEDDEFFLSSTAAAEAASRIEANLRRGDGECSCYCLFSFIRLSKLKCIIALLLGISVFISALFWLPPFLKLSDPGDNDLDSLYRGHAIVASFKLQKPVSFVKDNVSQLEADIYDELESANAKVVIISLEGSGLNSTYVMFGIDSLSKSSNISLAELSLIQSNFGFFVTGEAKILLTTTLFGEPSFFEVLKFPGGITIIPHQHVFPLQKVQISFNFTLNNSILQIQENFKALCDQLNSGLHLTRQEILYIRLTNSRGSTVAPPATVQTSVVLTVGVPSMPRVKQLVKTIKDSPTRNLGLNNSVFGKVKQVSLSSILPAGGASSPTPAPAPGPTPHFHHHHQHHSHGTSYRPSTASSHPPTRAPQPIKGSPAHRRSYRASPHGSPAPIKSYHASSPGFRFRFKDRRPGKIPEHSPTHVAVAPSMLHHHPSAAPLHRLAKPPTPVLHQISPSSCFPNVVYARAPPPPSRNETDPEPLDKTPPVASLTSSGGGIMAGHWLLSLLAALSLQPW